MDEKANVKSANFVGSDQAIPTDKDWSGFTQFAKSPEYLSDQW